MGKRAGSWVRWATVAVLSGLSFWLFLDGSDHGWLLGVATGVIAIVGVFVRGREHLYVVGAGLAFVWLVLGSWPADAGPGGAGVDDGYGGYCGSVFWPGDVSASTVYPDPLPQGCEEVRQQRRPVAVVLGVAACLTLVGALRPRRQRGSPSNRPLAPVD